MNNLELVQEGLTDASLDTLKEAESRYLERMVWLQDSLKSQQTKLSWVRKEIQKAKIPTKRMSMKDIETALGHKVEIT